MYRAFNLSFNQTFFNSNEEYLYYKNIGEEQYNDIKGKSEKILTDLTIDGVIDGTSLTEIWFKSINTDVFISHSHNDKDLSLAFSGWLKQELKLTTFVDECIWGCADELQETIDKKYCKNDDDITYNYTKRNFSTSHVHAMLTTSLMKVIDKTEIVIFLNTEETIPKAINSINQKDKYTLSPWIYNELMITNIIQEHHWSEYRNKVLLEFANDRKLLIIKYKVPLNRLTPLSINDINNWIDNFKSKSTPHERYGLIFGLKNYENALNCLYDIMFGKEEN